MSEYEEMPGANDGETAVAEPVVVEPPPVEVTEEPAAVAGETAEPMELKDEPHKLTGSARTKLKLEEARQRIAELEAQQAQSRQAAPALDPTEPNLYEFDDVDKWRAAVSAHHAKKATEQVEALVQSRTAAQSQREAQRKVIEADEKFGADKPDFDDAIEDLREAVAVVASKAPQTLGALDAALSASEIAPALKYHFGKHPDDFFRVCQMDPIQAVKELTRIEGRLMPSPSATTKKTTQAPPPITPITSSGVIVTPKVSRYEEF
jgi:hypothetical protein